MLDFRSVLLLFFALSLCSASSSEFGGESVLAKRQGWTAEPTAPPADETESVLIPALIIILGVGIPCGCILIWCTCTSNEPSKIVDPLAPEKWPDLEEYYYTDEYYYVPQDDQHSYYYPYYYYGDDRDYYYYYEEAGDLDEISEPYEYEYEEEDGVVGGRGPFFPSDSDDEDDSGSSYEYEYELEEEEVEIEETVSEEVSYEEETEEEEDEVVEEKVFMRVLYGDSYKVIPLTSSMTMSAVIDAFSQKLPKPLPKGPSAYYLELAQASGQKQKLNANATVADFGFTGMVVANLRKK